MPITELGGAACAFFDFSTATAGVALTLSATGFAGARDLVEVDLGGVATFLAGVDVARFASTIAFGAFALTAGFFALAGAFAVVAAVFLVDFAVVVATTEVLLDLALVEAACFTAGFLEAVFFAAGFTAAFFVVFVVFVVNL